MAKSIHKADRVLGDDTHRVASSIGKSGAQIVQNVMSAKSEAMTADKRDELQDNLTDAIERTIVSTLIGEEANAEEEESVNA